MDYQQSRLSKDPLLCISSHVNFSSTTSTSGNRRETSGARVGSATEIFGTGSGIVREGTSEGHQGGDSVVLLNLASELSKLSLFSLSRPRSFGSTLLPLQYSFDETAKI